MTILVTGGAGFIGSNLVKKLLRNREQVRIIDNLSSGSIKNIKTLLEDKKIEFVKGDLLNFNDIEKVLEGVKIVYHLAANPEIRANIAGSKEQYQQNVMTTFNLIESIIDSDVDTLAFTSSSTVYGEAETIPTPEEYGPLKPISYYGGSKLADEALISAYAYMTGFKAVIYRLANIVGANSNHGVIYDFIQKLKANQKELEVLGDGTQSKSYLYVSDCVDGMILGVKKSQRKVNIYNIGSSDQVKVLKIAEIVKHEMGLDDLKTKLTGGVEGGRGWKGDVKIMQLDTTELRKIGWAPQYNSAEAVRITARKMIEYSE